MAETHQTYITDILPYVFSDELRGRISCEWTQLGLNKPLEQLIAEQKREEIKELLNLVSIIINT